MKLKYKVSRCSFCIKHRIDLSADTLYYLKVEKCSFLGVCHSKGSICFNFFQEKSGPSWTFRATNKDTTHYNIHARNPLYAGAEYSCAWELTSISNHFHPSAQHFADSLLRVRSSLFLLS